MRLVLALISLLLSLGAVAYYGPEYLRRPIDDAARSAAPGQHVRLSDGFIHYRWSGPETGPVIVLVHGFSTPSFIYQQNITALNIAGFRTLSYDQFGRGWSDRPRADYTIDFYDRALVELLNTQSVSGPVGLVGLSMGAPIVAEFAARRPERVHAVALLVPAGLKINQAEGLKANLIRSPGLGDWLWRVFGKSIVLDDRQYQESGLAPENRLAGDVTEQIRYRGYLDALLSTLRHMPLQGREQTYARLAQTGLPTLAIFGQMDETVPLASAQILSRLMPDGDIKVIENGTHGLNYQRHREINPILNQFFTSVMLEPASDE